MDRTKGEQRAMIDAWLRPPTSRRGLRMQFMRLCRPDPPGRRMAADCRAPRRGAKRHGRFRALSRLRPARADGQRARDARTGKDVVRMKPVTQTILLGDGGPIKGDCFRDAWPRSWKCGSRTCRTSAPFRPTGGSGLASGLQRARVVVRGGEASGRVRRSLRFLGDLLRARSARLRSFRRRAIAVRGRIGGVDSRPAPRQANSSAERNRSGPCSCSRGTNHDLDSDLQRKEVLPG